MERMDAIGLFIFGLLFGVLIFVVYVNLDSISIAENQIKDLDCQELLVIGLDLDDNRRETLERTALNKFELNCSDYFEGGK